ncbi:MAG: UDP-glucuronate 5-epimerase [Candidatus Endolissoclinum sp. TMED37]|nr:MAG: UDP-glucuronate 5-epimerase [Candidatus Endolissoclinum sp. TMED37]
MNSLEKLKKVAVVTGSAGFVGFHVCKYLLEKGWRVIGVDNLNSYYDISLKKNREKILLKNKNYRSINKNIEKPKLLYLIFKEEMPEIVIHLGAQAGVRYSIKNPRAYFESNILGTFELLEAAKAYPPKHMLLASTSSIYGLNKKIPFKETDKTDHQVSFYAATKKTTENLAHSYSHLFKLPITMFRFFTVYGPWGRPDMAYFKFTCRIFKGLKIDVYNNGEMERDFTYIDDLSHAIYLLIYVIPQINNKLKYDNDTLSPVAPYRVVNIGNSRPVKLLDFIKEIEKNIGLDAKINMLPMQIGDVFSTWACNKLLNELTGFRPNTNIDDGIKQFVEWFKSYHHL